MSGDLDNAILLRREYKERARRGRTFAVLCGGLLMVTLADKFARTLGVDMTAIYPDSWGTAAAIGTALWNLIGPVAVLGVFTGSLYYFYFRRRMSEGNKIDELREGQR